MKPLSIIFGLLLMTLAGFLAAVRASDPSFHWLIFSVQNTGQPPQFFRTLPGTNTLIPLEAIGSLGRDFAWSPDGRTVVYSGLVDNVFQLHTLQGTSHTITDTTTASTNAAWSPDGKRLVYLEQIQSTLSGVRTLYSQIFVLDFQSFETALVWDGFGIDGLSWSPDGSAIAFARRHEETSLEIYTLALGTDQKPQPLTSDRELDIAPAWSPDGAWLAFHSFREPPGVYKMQADGSELELVYPVPGLTNIPLTWSPDGEWIVFASNQVRQQQLLRVRPDGSDVQPLNALNGYYKTAQWVAHHDEKGLNSGWLFTLGIILVCVGRLKPRWYRALAHRIQTAL